MRLEIVRVNSVCKGVRGFPMMVSSWEPVTLGYGFANGQEVLAKKRILSLDLLACSFCRYSVGMLAGFAITGQFSVMPLTWTTLPGRHPKPQALNPKPLNPKP